MSTGTGIETPPSPWRAVLRRCVGPAAVAAAAAAGAAVLFVRDPHTPGAYGLCPFHVVTGLWCPGCGGLRAAHDLTHGDLWESLSSNLFVAPLALVLVVAWTRWVVGRWRGGNGRMIVLGPAATVVTIGALVGFTVVRNTPWGSGLAPG